MGRERHHPEHDGTTPPARRCGRLVAIMINAIRIHTMIESDNLRIPELAGLVGKRVEILVVEEDAASAVASTPGVTAEPGAGNLTQVDGRGERGTSPRLTADRGHPTPVS